MADDLFEKGDRRRREVLGDAHVDRSDANKTEFTEEFLEFVTRYAWGEVWSRSGLEDKTRSMLNLAMLAALHRESEFKLHVKGALNNGVTPDEIKEVLLQVSIYAGVPAALSAFHWARDVMNEVNS